MSLQSWPSTPSIPSRYSALYEPVLLYEQLWRIETARQGKKGDIQGMNDVQQTLLEATRLTQAGQLAEATALNQDTLGSKNANEPSCGPTSNAEAPIDAEFSVLDDTASAERTSPQQTPLTAARRSASEHSGGIPGRWSPQEHHRSRSIPSFRTAPTGTTAGGRWVEQTYSNAHGSRPYKLYLPGGYTRETVPLFVLIHGCTQSALH